MLRLVSSLLLLLSASTDFTYLDSPTEEWRVPFLSVGPRNGVFLSPDAQLLAVVAESGHVLGLDPVSGDELWTHAPLGTNIRSKSGITFNYAGDVPYLVYAVTEESGLNDQSWYVLLGCVRWMYQVLKSLTCALQPLDSLGSFRWFRVHDYWSCCR